ncbi:hypothetical protein Zmor_026246 [Zophobas morio]|uniref:BMP and activin membrane-bound inhibitor C-terminal domain-containing protein n=2 Tax=Zophobas morio TaxID=2755281 RepID=A0AA38HTA8_9CUCU|nr:hypothetical protein Zmor_026246 [Zophobas morio]
MCKSSEGRCFSNLLDHVGHHSKDYRGRHGCVELLSENEKNNSDLCSDPPPHKKSLMFCCYHDMCNHMDSPLTKDLINNTLGEFQDSSDNHYASIANLQEPIDYINSQVWLRAATIAVPVCGAVILFVLVALAVKILRNENQNSTSHKLGSSYDHHVPSQSKHGCDKLEHSYDNILRKPHLKCLYHYQADDLQRIQVPLLIQNEISTHQSGNKNETNAKLNLMQDKTVVLDIEKVSPVCSKSNLINHVNNDKYVDIKFANDDKLFINSINH